MQFSLPTDPVFIGVAVTFFLFAVLLGFLIAHLRAGKHINDLREQNGHLRASLELEKRNAEEKLEALNQARQQLADTFSALSARALKHNTDEFLKLAQENLKQFQVKAQGDLEQREKAIEHLVKPIKDALEKTENQVRVIEKERKEAYGALHKHLEHMAQSQQALQHETRHLVQALRRPEVRGQWGELTLKRLAELAGMVEHCDFFEQEHVRSADGSARPDMIVRMPDRRDIIVDAKTPLDAYLRALESTDDTVQQQELQTHARHVRERVRELASKGYWSQFKNAPDFVVLFIPGDQFLAAALERDHELMESALRQKVILATPTSFVALLRAIAYGWRQEQLAENAEIIRQVGEDLFARLVTFSDHLAKLGRSLESSVKNYNNAVGSFDSRVVPGARKFTELGVHSEKALQSPEQVEHAPKTVESQVGEK
jgi:DNA recombination protein RmuC